MLCFPLKGETKPDENSNKETSEEKQDDDNDYHRSDEQVDLLLIYFFVSSLYLLNDYFSLINFSSSNRQVFSHAFL